MNTLRLIFADQLSESVSSLEGCNHADDIILMCEVREEATHVKHHQKKIAFLFSAMRHFAQSLSGQGYRVIYVRLDDPDNTGSFRGEVKRCAAKYNPAQIVLTHPGEYRVLQEVRTWSSVLGIPVEIRPDQRFLCTPEAFAHWAGRRKQLRMEYFYREMRQQYDILMADGAPVGGKWNYDADNRKPPKTGLQIPANSTFPPDEITTEVMQLVSQHFSSHFGRLEPFCFAVTRKQALTVLEQFIQQRLVCFGDYQDAMLEGEPWMFHSHLSFYLNVGLLLPLECVKAAEDAYTQGKAPLNAVEGFIRQIIGWREYVRGIYWLNMPEYASLNYFEASRDLPDFYWHGDTKMNCLRQCIQETSNNAYAHHIQRLMVLGNFALLTGIDPKQVNEWFLAVYADAFEWVELPNVSGMILFADGGYLASKPYAAGGSYIHKMSDYCKNCRYQVTRKSGPDACPFHYLYWDFLARNRDKLSTNPRLGMMYSTYHRMNDDKKAAIREESALFLLSLEHHRD
ncbi:cryptochrome/photolyase family protein [Vibrio quintilis]|uniref:Deoxyribodipyrimidine photo-lyase-related protein n=1 Tax=Vibrio quintilis TaxID=1117707 RepID=A0A1M7YYT1_9VIBR|nr:cryptochrome/photolyase family protein [Vibrio quintilis]SHO57745.1 Deoxyribodipyrimidine photo-lyase-related protein [Vibrio quintilis]